jgi:prepilin-type N-terminal cleavage/methylation domain-containing protein
MVVVPMKSRQFRPPSRAKRSAFTLLEMVIVAVVMAILVATAIPRYADSLALNRVDSSARRVALDLAAARLSARTMSASRSVTFRAEPHSDYQISGMTDLDNPAMTWRVALRSDPWQSVIENADFGGSAGFSFNGFGLPDCAGEVVIRSGSHTRTVQVDSEGRISIVP